MRKRITIDDEGWEGEEENLELNVLKLREVLLESTRAQARRLRYQDFCIFLFNKFTSLHRYKRDDINTA